MEDTAATAEDLKLLKEKETDLRDRLSRLKGVRESTEKSLKATIAEIKEKGYDPNKLQSVVREMEEKFNEDYKAYKDSLEEAEKAIKTIEDAVRV